MPKFRLLAGSHSEGFVDDQDRLVYLVTSLDPSKRGYADFKGNLLHPDPNGLLKFPPKQFHAGDIIDSKSQLDVKFNQPGAVKYERLDDMGRSFSETPGRKPDESLRDYYLRMADEAGKLEGVAGGQSDEQDDEDITDTYDAMTMKELRSHAAAEEISLGDAGTKADIIQLLRTHDLGCAAR
jgi:hypothetical protein